MRVDDFADRGGETGGRTGAGAPGAARFRAPAGNAGSGGSRATGRGYRAAAGRAVGTAWGLWMASRLCYGLDTRPPASHAGTVAGGPRGPPPPPGGGGG